MQLQLVPLTLEHILFFKREIQHAFQQGYEEVYGKSEETILPEQDIDQSLDNPQSVAHLALLEGEIVGGAVVVIHPETQHNELDFLFVRHGFQGRGIGKRLWFALEAQYPETKIWQTCTPYFERRNIHFYVNVCGFYITKFFNEKLPMENEPEYFIGDAGEGMFQLEKRML